MGRLCVRVAQSPGGQTAPTTAYPFTKSLFSPRPSPLGATVGPSGRLDALLALLEMDHDKACFYIQIDLRPKIAH